MKLFANITRNSFKLRRLFIALLAISSAYLSSCQKDLLVSSIHPYVLAAKNQLENRKQVVNSSDSIKGIGNYANKIAKWDKAEVGIISLGQAVYVPLEYDKSVKYSPEGSKTTIPLDKLSYLLIYKDLDSNLHTEIVKKLPNKESLLKTNNVNDRNFSGLIAVEDWDGNPLKYYFKQSNGKILRLNLLSTGYGNVIVNSVANVGQVCFDSSWQVIWCLDGGTNCPPITLTYNKCFTTTSDTDGTPNSDPGTGTGSTTGVDYGSGGAVSGGGSSPESGSINYSEILNKVTNPCIQKLVSDLKNSNVAGKAAEIITALDKSTLVQVTIVDSDPSNLISSAPASSLNLKPDGTGIFKATIYLDREFLPQTSKEYATELILHEIIHAYIGFIANNSSMSQLLEHSILVDKYLDIMANYLTNLYGTSPRDAMALTWFGVSRETSLFANREIFYYNGGSMTKEELKRIAGDYAANLAGSPNCQSVQPVE